MRSEDDHDPNPFGGRRPPSGGVRMRHAVGVLLLTLVIGTGCGSDDDGRPRPTATATANPTASATAEAPATATAVATATRPTATVVPTATLAPPTATVPPTATASPEVNRLRAGAAEGTLDLPIGMPLGGFVDEQRNIFPSFAQPIDDRERPYSNIQV